MRRARVSRGLSLIEVVAALAIAGLVALSATALLRGTIDASREMATSTRVRPWPDWGLGLARELLADARVGGVPLAPFVGEAEQVRFESFCPTPAGWKEPCPVVLRVEASSSGARLVLDLEGRTHVLRDSIPGARFWFLRDPAAPAGWASRWGSQIVAPPAIALEVADGVTVLRVGAP